VRARKRLYHAAFPHAFPPSPHAIIAAADRLDCCARLGQGVYLSIYKNKASVLTFLSSILLPLKHHPRTTTTTSLYVPNSTPLRKETWEQVYATPCLPACLQKDTRTLYSFSLSFPTTLTSADSIPSFSKSSLFLVTLHTTSHFEPRQTFDSSLQTHHTANHPLSFVTSTIWRPTQQQ
jgi:hypothetical protein